MAKLNVVIPAVNVMVDGVEYRKVERTVQAGDKVRLVSGGGDRCLRGFENGDICVVRAALDSDGDVTVRIDSTDVTGYAKPDQLVKVTAEEIATEAAKRAERKQREEAELKWSAIGREVNEYKDGDVVRFTESTGAPNYNSGSIAVIANVTREYFTFGGDVNDTYGGDTSWCELVMPVEQRFDRK